MSFLSNEVLRINPDLKPTAWKQHVSTTQCISDCSVVEVSSAFWKPTKALSVHHFLSGLHNPYTSTNLYPKNTLYKIQKRSIDEVNEQTGLSWSVSPPENVVETHLWAQSNNCRMFFPHVCRLGGWIYTGTNSLIFISLAPRSYIFLAVKENMRKHTKSIYVTEHLKINA